MISKKENPMDYKKGIYLSTFSLISLLLVFYFYSLVSSPGNPVFINQSLYFFGQIVLISFFGFILLFLLGVKKTFFSERYYDSNPLKLVFHIQLSFKSKYYRSIFIITTVFYFLFFGFLSNFFVIFNNDGTVFSLFPATTNHQEHKEHQNMNMTKDNAMNMTKDNVYYPKYNLIICCNFIGYVPMLILSVNSNFSFLLIPMNFLLGLVISILVGLNLTLNVYILKHIRAMKISKKNFYGLLGMSSGLFVGCPTCAGSFFYSLAGFSSLIAFSYLSFYQIIFIFISIPILFISLMSLSKISQKKYLDSCKIN
ncbi:MAG: hypothetical protein ACTHLL_06475 [Candidatus Nitrosocosmicus sp.]